MAFSAASADPELFAQCRHGVVTGGHRLTDFSFGNVMADADDHAGILGLCSQDEFVQACQTQPVNTPLMFDLHFALLTKQLLAAEPSQRAFTGRFGVFRAAIGHQGSLAYHSGSK
jgi:hypothetical protein